MKSLFVLFVVVAVSGALAETYTSENDDFDIDTLAKDKDKLLAFAKCFMGTGTCDAVAADFKKDLPEAVQQACAKCTPAQKYILKTFLQALKDKTPDTYDQLKHEMDPEHKYFAALEAAIANA